MNKGRSFTVCVQIVVRMSQTHLRSGNLLLGSTENFLRVSGQIIQMCTAALCRSPSGNFRGKLRAGGRFNIAGVVHGTDEFAE